MAVLLIILLVTVALSVRAGLYGRRWNVAGSDSTPIAAFEDRMQVHVGQLEARTGDGRLSERRQLRLWFRAQDTEVAPLIIATPHG